MYIAGAKFEEHCSNISRVIFLVEPPMTSSLSQQKREYL